MSAIAIFELMVLLGFIANVADWAARGRQRLLSWPSGMFGWAVNALIGVVIILCPLTLLHILPENLFQVSTGVVCLTGCLYAVFRRHSKSAVEQGPT